MNQKHTGSKGEKLIRKILINRKEKFIFDPSMTFAFKNCPKNMSRKRFDFVLINEELIPVACIEYDGRQHFEPCWYGRSEREFEDACMSDDIKTDYCEKRHLPLLRIRYDQDELIEDMILHFLYNPNDYIKDHNPMMKADEYWSPRTRHIAA